MRSLQTIPFVKASGCGNDFLLIDAVHAPTDALALANLSRALCDRSNGIGADGVEWMFAEASGVGEADIRVALINSDGSEAEVSGNGTRCVAAWLAEQRDLREVRVRTAAGIKTCQLTSKQGSDFEFEANMGKPVVGPPLSIALPSSSYGAREDFLGMPISMGNPQFVIFVDEFFAGWQAKAAAIQTTSYFPDGVNVDFVRIVGGKSDCQPTDRNTIASRFFERGAGETQSSGTGSCASAVAAIAAGHCDSPVRVMAPGGSQTVRWEEEVYLRGPARLICRGEFFLSEPHP